MRRLIGCTALALILAPMAALADDPAPLKPGVRGLITKARGKVEIDGRLRDWAGAFCTPLQYAHPKPLERATQVLYLWDDEALYIGLKALDTQAVNHGSASSLWNGDAIEFYIDTRAGNELRGKDWADGAIHLFFTAFDQAEVKPRWAMRKGIATSDTPLKGIELAATSDKEGWNLEFKLPWANFPGFKPAAGNVLALDIELCAADGKARVDRTFSYGSPLSVTQPASQGKVELVERFEPDYLATVGPATFPMWVDTPWVQPERAKVQAVVGIPESFQDIVGEVEVRLHDADGKVFKTVPAKIDPFGPKGRGFLRAVARWSIDDAAPNTYFATARIASRTGKTMATVAPRMVSEAQVSGR